MRITTRLRRDVAILEPDDRVTVETEPQLTETVRSLIECGQRRFVLDLGSVPYIDSVGLGAIVGAYTAARRRGGDLKLLHVRGHNRHLLAVTPTCHWIEYLDVAAPILAEPLRPVDGAIAAPARPGIGLAWDESTVHRYAIG